MSNRQGNLDFRLMSLIFKIRDKLKPPRNILLETGLKFGDTVLDYGCGPGGFSIAAAEIVGREGEVFALDIHPLAVKMVARKAAKRNLSNIRVIRADSPAILASRVFNMVILFDIFHGFSDPDGILTELHRVLKPEGILAFSDHHLKREKIVSGITDSGLFTLTDDRDNIYRFSPIN